MPLVDAVLEEIRVGLEMNEPSQRQRRIAYIRYLGELYTYQMLQAQVTSWRSRLMQRNSCPRLGRL